MRFVFEEILECGMDLSAASQTAFKVQHLGKLGNLNGGILTLEKEG